MMLPPQVLLIPPQYLLFKLASAGSTRCSPLVVPQWFGSAFYIFLLRQFFMTTRVEPSTRQRWSTAPTVFPDILLADPSAARRPILIPLRALPRSCTPGTTSSGRCFYTGENPDHWTLSVGLAQFRTLHQVGVEPDHGGDAAVHGAGDPDLLRRPARLRRGRDADGGEGVTALKVAVVRGRLDLHTRAGLGAVAGTRSASRCATWCSTTWTRSGVRSSGALPRRMLERQAFAGRLSVTGELDRALEGADVVLIQIRVGGQQARLCGRDRSPARAAASGRRRPGPGASQRRCARCPAVLEIAARAPGAGAPMTRGSSTSPTRWASSPEPLLDAGHRAVGLCNVAIGFQRSFAEAAWASRPRASSSTRSASTT